MLDKSSIIDQVEKNRDLLIKLTSDLIRFNTANPPGKNTADAQRWLGSVIEDGGLTKDLFDVFPGEPDLVGVMTGTGGGRSIILNGHMDVAEVRPDENWTHPPFEPVVQDERIYGRGATDMKGGLAACVVALRSLKECNIKLRGDVIFESVIGEEAGEPGTVRCIERGYKADFALIPEPSEFNIAGQGGVITGWITIKSPQTIHDGARRLCIHAGGGLDGANTIEKMVKIIESLQDLERHWAVMKSHPMVPIGTTTINPAVIEGGRHPAFMADECKLWITVHYLPNEDYEQVTREIEQTILHVAKADPWLKGNLPQFKWGGTSLVRDKGEIFPAASIDPNHIGVKIISQAHRDVTGKPAEIVCSPTVTDAGWFARAGIPIAIYGPGSLRQAHIVNEYVEISDLMVAAKSIALTIYNWCQ